MNNYDNSSNSPNSMGYKNHSRNRAPGKPGWNNNKFFDKKGGSQRNFNNSEGYGNNSRSFNKSQQFNNRKPFKGYGNDEPENRGFYNNNSSNISNNSSRGTYSNSSFHQKGRPGNFNNSWKDDHSGLREDRFKGGNSSYKRKQYFDRDHDLSNDGGYNNIYSGDHNSDFRGRSFANEKFSNSSSSSNKKFDGAQEKSFPPFENRRSALGICAPPPPPEPIQGRSILVQVSPPNVELFSVISNKMHEFGDIRSEFNLIDQRGISFFNFQDLRSARTAWEKMQSFTIDNYYVNVRYSLPKANIHSQLPSAMKFQGTILAVLEANYGEAIEQDDENIFRQYGEIRSIYTLEGRQNTRVVEYFDLRATESAYNNLHGSTLNGKGKLHIIYFWDGSLGGWPPLPPRNYPKNESNHSYRDNNSNFESSNSGYGDDSTGYSQSYRNQSSYNSSLPNKKPYNKYTHDAYEDSKGFDNYGNGNYKKSRWNSNQNDSNNYDGGYSPSKPFNDQRHFGNSSQGTGYDDHHNNDYTSNSGNYQNSGSKPSKELNANPPSTVYADQQQLGTNNITALSTINALSAISAIANSQPNNVETLTSNNNVTNFSNETSKVPIDATNTSSGFANAPSTAISENATNLQLISALIAQQHQKNKSEILTSAMDTNVAETQDNSFGKASEGATPKENTTPEFPSQGLQPNAGQTDITASLQSADTAPVSALPSATLDLPPSPTKDSETLVVSIDSTLDNEKQEETAQTDVKEQVENSPTQNSSGQNVQSNNEPENTIGEDIELLSGQSVVGSADIDSKPSIRASTKEGNAQIAELLDILSQVKNQ